MDEPLKAYWAGSARPALPAKPVNCKAEGDTAQQFLMGCSMRAVMLLSLVRSRQATRHTSRWSRSWPNGALLMSLKGSSLMVRKGRGRPRGRSSSVSFGRASARSPYMPTCMGSAKRCSPPVARRSSSIPMWRVPAAYGYLAACRQLLWRLHQHMVVFNKMALADNAKGLPADLVKQ